MRQPGKAQTRGPGILVVDDERQIVELLTRYLVQHGFHALGAYSAAEAREKVRGDNRIAVLISDVRMPGESGLALAEELVRERGDAAALEVVLITGAGLGDGGPEPVLAPAFEILRKPFRPSEMAAAVNRALAASERRRSKAAAEARRAAPTGTEAPPPEGPPSAEALRAPLLPILAAAEALVEAAALDEAETREHARRIREAALRLLALIEDRPGEAPDEPGDAEARAARYGGLRAAR
jgi:FixJ family two-component response regulator